MPPLLKYNEESTMSASGNQLQVYDETLGRELLLRRIFELDSARFNRDLQTLIQAGDTSIYEPFENGMTLLHYLFESARSYGCAKSFLKHIITTAPAMLKNVTSYGQNYLHSIAASGSEKLLGLYAQSLVQAFENEAAKNILHAQAMTRDVLGSRPHSSSSRKLNSLFAIARHHRRDLLNKLKINSKQPKQTHTLFSFSNDEKKNDAKVNVDAKSNTATTTSPRPLTPSIMQFTALFLPVPSDDAFKNREIKPQPQLSKVFAYYKV
jgi:hypothetical protein